MAKMIPSLLSLEVKSPAERKIFEWFKNAPDTDGWIVLHSLGIANHRTVIYGEIDFFVIAPKLGVFAIEVKGGRVRRDNGTWFFTDRYGRTSSKNRGPFEQANEGIFSLFDTIKSRCGSRCNLSRILFGYGVMFPDINFEVNDPDVESWRIFDIDDGKKVKEYIERLARNTKRKWVEKYGPLKPEKIPDLKDVRQLADLLRGDFDIAISLSSQIQQAETAIVKLTNEQLVCLDQLEDNSRCLIRGPAGTGKTLLVIEEAKKAVNERERVAVFCFNAKLGEWLNGLFEKQPKELRPAFIGTFHSFMMKIASENEQDLEIRSSNMNEFFRNELPIIALEAIEEAEVLFDRVIIDEAQDLINEDYLDVLDVLLKDGVGRGKWSMFGDFSAQAIFSEQAGAKEMLRKLERRTSFVNYKLRINCRNTEPIAQEIASVTGFSASTSVWSKVKEPPVHYYTYKSEEEQLEKLESVIVELLKNKILPEQITILSPFKRESSIVSRFTSKDLRNYNPKENKGMTFSTIHSFKGLENSVIVITDIATYENNKLMYVGLSRARSALIIFETAKAKRERTNLVLGRLK